MEAVTIPELDPEIWHDPQPMPELCLLMAVVELALLDLRNPSHQAKAKVFFESQGFELFCEYLGFDAEAIRRAVSLRK